VRADGRERLGREEDGAVTVSLEVDADVVGLGGMVQVLDAGWDARYGYFLNTCVSIVDDTSMITSTDRREVLGGGTVSVRCLDDSDLDLVAQSSSFNELADERSHKSTDLISIQHPERPFVVQVKVHQTIGVTIQTASPLAWLHMFNEGRRKLLLRLDKVGTTVVVERSRSGGGGVVHDEG
jgi:hypothetical protein